MKPLDFILREATPNDMPALLALIKELATFEKAPEAVTNTVADMFKDGFGPHPVIKAWLAWHDTEAVAMAVVYIRYSTWRGKGLYLEDLYVKPAYRGKGIAQRLVQKVKEEAERLHCRFISWQVLDWNTDALHFYDWYAVEFDPSWVNVLWPAPFNIKKQTQPNAENIGTLSRQYGSEK